MSMKNSREFKIWFESRHLSRSSIFIFYTAGIYAIWSIILAGNAHIEIVVSESRNSENLFIYKSPAIIHNLI